MTSTGDFSEVRKCRYTDEIYERGAYTSVKRKPRKLINLRPLNLSGIKKEIEECSEDDEKHTNPIKKLITEVITEVKGNDNKFEQILDGDHLRDITNCETESVQTLQETDDKYCIDKPVNAASHVSNTNSASQVKENFIPQYKNDSFDLDFSALSLSTPVKQHEENSSSINKADYEKTQFRKFITPKIHHGLQKNQNSLLKQSYQKTPSDCFNRISAKKLVTPSTNAFKSTLSKKVTPSVSESHLFLKKVDKNSSTFPVNNMYKIATPLRKVPTEDEVIDEFVHTKEDTSCFSTNTLRDDTFKRIKVNDIEYIIFSLIGKGGSSEVYQCYNLKSKIHTAIKCVSLQNSASATSYINEVKLLQQLQNCSKIIKMYDYEILDSQNKLLVVLENGGKDLSTILKQLASQKSHVPMYMLIFYWMEMLYAVKQIHGHGIIHSDLKPANFLKVDEGLKLIDFGIASSVQTDMTSVIKTKQEGSCNYISPEALNSDTSANQNANLEKYKIHYKSDVWSLGCILYQFVYRRTPFQHIIQLWPKLAAIMNPAHKIDYPEVDWVSPKIICTIKKCLQYNVKLRPSIDELIAEYEAILHNI